MIVRADRWSGLFFMLFGLAMLYVVIPGYIEDGDAGTLAPATMPSIVSWIIVVCGACLILKPSKHELHDAHQFARAGLYSIVLIVSVYAISKFGFIVIAPVMAFTVMLLIGERRPLWLVLGAVIMPGVIWFLVTQLLDRVLP